MSRFVTAVLVDHCAFVFIDDCGEAKRVCFRKIRFRTENSCLYIEPDA